MRSRSVFDLPCRLLEGMGLVLVFLVCVTSGLLIHLDSPAGRRLAISLLNDSLASSFRGKIVLERVGSIGPTGFEGASLGVYDPDGQSVLWIGGARARIATWPLLKSAVLGRGPASIDVVELAIDQVTVHVTTDERGSLGIARAFETRAPREASPTSRGVRVSIRRIDLAHASIDHRSSETPFGRADIDSVQGSLSIDTEKASILVDRFALATQGVARNADARGRGRMQLVFPLAPGQVVSAQAAWQGTVAEVATALEMTTRDGSVDLVVDAPSVSQSALQSLWPGARIEAPVSLRAEAHGKLSDPTISVQATQQQASLCAYGQVHLTGDEHVELHIASRAVDTQQLFQGALPSHLDVEGDWFLGVAADRGVRSEATLHVASTSSVAGWALPPSTIRLNVVSNPEQPLVADVALVANEPGAPIRLDGRLISENGSLLLTFDGRTRAPDLGRVARLRKAVAGTANLSTHGTVDLEHDRLDASLAFESSELRRDGTRIGGASVKALLSGSARAPLVDARLRADVLEFGAVRLLKPELDARGPAGKILLRSAASAQNGSALKAEATLDVSGPLVLLRDLAVAIDRGGETATLRSGLVRIRSDRVDIEEGEIAGLGAPVHADAEANLTRGIVHFRAAADGLEIARLSRLLGLDDLDGLLTFGADLEFSRRGADGRLAIQLENGKIGPVHGAKAHLFASVQGRQLSAEMRGELGDAAWFRLRAPSLAIGGEGPISSLLQAWGSLDLASEIDVEKLDPALVQAVAPGLLSPNGSYDGVAGKLSVYGEATRSSEPAAMPSLGLSVNLMHGALRRRETPKTTAGQTEWKADDIGLGVVVQIDANSGATALAARLDDAAGEIAELDARSAFVPYAWIFSAADQRWELLRRVPWEARFALPRRSIGSLPLASLCAGCRGDLEGTLQMRGSLSSPDISVTGTITKGRFSRAGLGSPFDAELRASYDGARAHGDLGVRIDDREVVSAQTAVDLSVADLFRALARASAPLPWEGSAKVHVAGLPAETLRSLQDRQIHAVLRGDITLDGLHRDARASLDLTANDLRIRDAAYGSTRLQVTLDGSHLNGSARYEQKDAFAQAQVSAGVRWGSRLLPVLDPDRPLAATLLASHFPLATLLPLFDETLSDLDGYLVANAHASLDPKHDAASVEGTAFLEEGGVEFTGLGLGIRDLSAKIVAAPGGVLRVEHLSAHGVSGEVQATATARIDRYGLADGAADVKVPASTPFPLMLEGAGYGAIDGNIAVSLRRSSDRKQLDVRANVPVLHVRIPSTSTRSLQDLAPIQKLRLGTRSGATDFVPLKTTAPSSKAAAVPEGSPKVKIAVNLGKEVEVKCGSLFKATLDGSTTIVLGPTLEVLGNVRLLSGYVDVQGKSFEIEEGTVTFAGDDPSNPQAVISAGWTAPDGTRVHAHFAGRLKTGQVTLTSEPELSRNDILALLLFGTSDGPVTSSGTATPNASGALGFAGTAAAQPLNRVLHDFGLGGISTRVDSSSVTPRPEVEVQVARDIALQVAWVLGAPAPGSNPDRTLFTLDWRFVQRWSLKTTVGDAGTSIFDVIWQYRY